MPTRPDFDRPHVRPTNYPWTPSTSPWRPWDEPGPPGLYWRGDWTPGNIYESGTVVFSNGEVWIALRNSVAVQPGTNPELWDSLANLTGGLNIQGFADRPDQLPVTGRSGQAWIVGDEKNLYVWDQNEDRWKDVGSIRGPEGERGPRGMRGFRGHTGLGIPEGGDQWDLLAKTSPDDFTAGWLSPRPRWHDLDLQSGWTPDETPSLFGNTPAPAQFSRDITGRICLRGVLTNTTIPPGPSVIATLPVWASPQFSEPSTDPPVCVEPDGTVWYPNPTSVPLTDLWVTLSGVSFSAQ